MSGAVRLVLGFDRAPAWFVFSSLVGGHALFYPLLTQQLAPWMRSTGLPLIHRAILGATGASLDGDRLALAALFFAMLLHLLTFYP